MSEAGKSRPYTAKKRWCDKEVQLILDYLKEESKFEYPTAQIFYQRLLASSGIKATWNLLRWKVRYLKETYEKAEAWRKSIDAGLLESALGPLAVNGKVIRMCPHYIKLKKIFGSKIDDGDDEAAALDADTSQHEHISVNEFEFDNESDNSEPMSETEGTMTLFTVPVSSTSRRRADVYNKTTHRSQLNSSLPEHSEDVLKEGERIEQKENGFQFYKWKTEQELELRKEELALRREELQIRILEIEKQERVAMHKIELKYKNKKNVKHA